MPNPTLSLSIPPQVLRGDFAGWLKVAMARRRMSQRMLALHSGLNHATISRLLTGSRDPSLSTVLALIRALEGPVVPLASPGIDNELPQEEASMGRPGITARRQSVRDPAPEQAPNYT